MALRSLDNALPISPERPKKMAKVTRILDRTPPNSGTNDENKAPMDLAPEYVLSQDLKALTDPEAKIEGLPDSLDSKDWMKVCESLNDVRRLALHHSSLLLPLLEEVLLVMVKSMKSPRSALCKTSVMASADIFQSYGHLVLSSDTFDQLLLRLLLTASQDKKFVCEEAERALQTMAVFLPPIPSLQKLTSYVNHTNPKVRAKAAVSIANCISKMTMEGMKEFGLTQLIKIPADLMNDRLPEAREAARRIGNWIFEAYSGDEEQKVMGLSALESWQSLCSSNLPPIAAQAMIKIVPQLQ